MKHREGAKPSDPGRIWSQIAVMAYYRAIYQRVIEIAAAADLPPSYFFQFLTSTYLHSQAAAVRRQADKDGRAISLGRVLTELADDLDRLGCPGYYASEWNALSADQVRADRDRLDQGVATVTNIVDRRVAHMDRAQVNEPLKVTQVHNAIDVVIGVFQRYETFLLDATTPDFTPMMVEDWEAIFLRPWLERRDERGT